MSEETRRQRLIAQAEADLKIEALQDQILALENAIERLQRDVPRELPEDREWRLEQLSPIQRELVEMTEIMFQRNIEQQAEAFLRQSQDITFAQGSQWKIGTQLRIKLPESYAAIPFKKDPL